MNLGPKADPDDLPRAGYIVIDLTSYIATELYYQGSRFTVHSLDIEVPAGTDMSPGGDTD